MKWVTLQRPSLDTIACSWLILHVIDPDGEILFVPYEEIKPLVINAGAIAYNIEVSEYFTRQYDECIFDVFLRKHQLEDPALEEMAHIVRGAVSGRYHLAPQSAGLQAI